MKKKGLGKDTCQKVSPHGWQQDVIELPAGLTHSFSLEVQSTHGKMNSNSFVS